VEWPLRFISRRSPPFLQGLAVTVAALAGAVAIRGLILGWPNAAGLSATYFPAYILATLYGGSRWGWTALVSSIVLGALTPSVFPNGISTSAVMVMFALSGVLTVMVASALRDTLLRYEEARRTQQATQRALDESEARLRMAQEVGGVGLWDWDLQNDHAVWSVATYRNLGLDESRDPSAEAILETAHPEDHDHVREILGGIRRGHVENLEHRVVREDGSVRWLLSRGDVLRGPDGRPIRALGVNIDITERRQAFDQIQESEARFRTLADSAPILMWVSKSDGRREFVNQTYVDFLGAPYDEAINFDWRERLDPEDLPRILKEQVAGESSRQLFTLEARYRRADGAWRWIRSISQPRRGPDGHFEGFIGIGFDVTDAKRAEADLKQINELLATRVREAMAERDEAEAALRHAQRMEAVGQLTGGVAHDFNNLLTVIIGALDLMQRNPGDEVRRGRMVEAALGAARRGERLTQQLLAFSRRQALRPEPIEIDAAVREAEPLLRRAVGEAVSLNFTLSGAAAVAMIDSSQFHAALMNLVVNARDAVSQGGMIRVETAVCDLAEGEAPETPPGAYVRLSVHDTGVGMDAETLSRVFEPFFTTKEVGKGTGLGLSQVYGFARQSGGGVAIESAPGQGASVRLYLPRSSALAPELAADEAPSVRGRALNVLLVEDDPDVAEMLVAMLSDMGHAVTHAAGPEIALRHIEGGDAIDLMLTDLIMPGGLTGVDLAHRALALRPALPVLLASGYTGDALAAADGAPWPLLRKPFSGDALAEAIAAVLEQDAKPA
jgi:PAS domain S-box-containing protein